MPPQQKGLGRRKRISTPSFYSMCLKTAGYPQGSAAETGGFQIGKALPMVISPCPVLLSESLTQGVQELQGRVVPCGWRVSAKAEAALCGPPGTEYPRQHQTLACSKDMSVSSSSLHQPLPLTCELKQENGESLPEEKRQKCFVTSREIANTDLCTPTRKLQATGAGGHNIS